MNKIIEYKVLVGAGYIDLQNKVNEHIKEGWQPIGGFYDECQAVVKYESDNINAPLPTSDKEGVQAQP